MREPLLSVPGLFVAFPQGARETHCVGRVSFDIAGGNASPLIGESGSGKSVTALLILGLTGFFTVALMLSLLIFVGEAVRDAFDPRKTFA
jgi:ABC-type glutathione transport system ATPase component